MNDYYIRAAVQTADHGRAMSEESAALSENITLALSGTAGDSGQDSSDRPVTVAELQRILHSALSCLRVYVLESDITSSQNAVRTIIEQSKF